jgi:hypothetical protein
LPSNFYGADWLQFSKKAGYDTVSFTLLEETDVYIGLGTRSSVKYEGYEELIGTEIETSDSARFRIYRKRFPRNSRVTVGSDIIILLPATQMQPAYDLKTITPYRTNVATVSAGVQKEQFGGRESAVVKSKNPVTIEWPIQIGVADIYSVTVKYFYPADTIRGRVQLIGYGNTMLLEHPIYFTQTKPGKWNNFTFNTGSMINAGNYRIRLIIENAEGLAISGIDLQ